MDVGGGIGSAVAEIVKSFPHIKGINFDLPHVVATAPMYDGVKHVGGDMFQAIPNADAVFMKVKVQIGCWCNNFSNNTFNEIKSYKTTFHFNIQFKYIEKYFFLPFY